MMSFQKIPAGCHECPNCTGRNGMWGLGAIADPESNKAGGTPFMECYECGGMGFLKSVDPNDILKEML